MIACFEELPLIMNILDHLSARLPFRILSVESRDAPVPAIILGGDWAFSPRWVWRNTFSFLALNLSLGLDDLSGGGLQFQYFRGVACA